jgi:hypothetical protein
MQGFHRFLNGGSCCFPVFFGAFEDPFDLGSLFFGQFQLVAHASQKKLSHVALTHAGMSAETAALSSTETTRSLGIRAFTAAWTALRASLSHGQRGQYDRQ